MGKGLALGVTTGKVIYLDDIPMYIEDVESKDKVTVSVLGRAYVLSTEYYTEVYPRVFVAVSVPMLGKGYAQTHILIDAPRSIVILRDDNRDKKIERNVYQAV